MFLRRAPSPLVLLALLTALPGAVSPARAGSDARLLAGKGSLTVPRRVLEGRPCWTVVRVRDAGTLDVAREGVQRRIVLLGVDGAGTTTAGPVTRAFRDEARRFLSNLVLGEEVVLETDPAAGARDRFGREAVYLWRAPEGTLVNLELIRQGYEGVHAKKSLKYLAHFRAWEGKARRAGRGCWSRARRVEPESGKGDGSKTKGGREGSPAREGVPAR